MFSILEAFNWPAPFIKNQKHTDSEHWYWWSTVRINWVFFMKLFRLMFNPWLTVSVKDQWVSKWVSSVSSLMNWLRLISVIWSGFQNMLPRYHSRNALWREGLNFITLTSSIIILIWKYNATLLSIMMNFKLISYQSMTVVAESRISHNLSASDCFIIREAQMNFD